MPYSFDEVDEQLTLLPMAARRALDWAGRKLSLEGWQSLPLDVRRMLIDLGAATTVDTGAVVAIVEAAKPKGTWCDPRPDPSADAPSQSIVDAFGPARPIHDNVWRALSDLDRFALAKIAEKGRPRRLEEAYREIIGASRDSSHLAPGGGVRMVDVGGKAPSLRSARAKSFVRMNPEAFAHLLANNPKGDVLGTARIAAILAAKKTSDWIPLCHPLDLTKVDVQLEADAAGSGVAIDTLVQTVGRTGVEMEALTAASAAALTVYDMLKAFDKGMEIGPTVLLEKRGGKGGDYRRS